MIGSDHAEAVQINAGLKRFAVGEAFEAEKAFRRAAALNPGGGVFYYLGAAVLQCGRPFDAIKTLRRGWRASPNDPATANLLALALRIVKRPGEAIFACQAGLADSPLLARTLRDMGDVGDGGPRGELIRLLSPAIMAPDAPPPLSATETATLGLALLESGDAGALADLRRRFDGHPRLNAVVRTLWARKLWREGEAAAALAELAGREDDDGGFFTVRALSRLRLDLETRGLAVPPRPAALDDAPPTISIRSLADCGRFAQTTLEYLLVRIAAEKAGWRVETPDWVGHWVFELDDPAVSALRPTFGGLGEALNDYIEGIGPPPPPNVDVGSPWTLRRFSPAYRERVQKWLTPRPIWRPRLEAAQNALRARGRTVVAFHLRRGDFVKLGYPITETRACLEWLGAHWRDLDDPVLYLASDEPASIRRAFADYAPITIEDLDCRWRGLEFLQDFHILANADILGASTASGFSFLAALLNQRARIFLRPNGDGRMTPFDPWRETTLSSSI